MSPTRIERPRGTHDVVPAEQPLWRLATETAEQVCAVYGYRPITTPVLEDTALFERTAGSGSDVVQKEMYTFEDRSGRSLALRPEGTAPICRAYVDHGMHRLPQPVKLYTVAPMYRYSAPQRGRYREHWQLSAEAIGSDEPSLDAELIHLYDTLVTRLGVAEYSLAVNSIGCRRCRPTYLDELTAWLQANDARLDDATREKARTSPLRVFDNLETKPQSVQEALLEAPKIGESLCTACREHFDAVLRDLDGAGVAYELVPTLVRGLDYYTRTTWEFVGAEEGAQRALAGGGRYDGLVEEIGGPPTPGVGFGAGIERLILALEHAGVSAPSPTIDVFFVTGPAAAREMRQLVGALRRQGVTAEFDHAGRSIKGQMTHAGRLGARITAVQDPEEGASGVFRLLERGKPDERVAVDDVGAAVRARLAR